MKHLKNCLKPYYLRLFTGLLCLFCFSQAWSQTFVIPDANLRTCLKQTYPWIFNSNDEVIIAEIQTIKTIECIGKGIQSLDGIGYFTELERLNVGSNQLQVIPPINTLTKLLVLQVYDNQLTALPDLSGNPALGSLDAVYNQIAVFPDITSNPNLSVIMFGHNQLQSLPDVSALTSLNTLKLEDNPLQSLPDLSANPSLVDLNISYTQIPVFPDLSQNINLRALRFAGNPQFTAFPDISHNPLLQIIDCSVNNLGTIPDLSALTDLAHFDCHRGGLGALPDLSKNTRLQTLACEGNHLTQLPDLSKCPQLSFLSCGDNQLISLPDLSSNAALKNLLCAGNNLTSLPSLANTKVGREAWSTFSAIDNKLTFEDIIPLTGPVVGSQFEYNPQQKLSQDKSVMLDTGMPFTIDLDIDDNVTSNIYTWYKDNVTVASNNSNVFTIADVTASDAGKYRVTVTNPNAPGVELESGITTLNIDVALGWIPDGNFRACLKETYPEIFNANDELIIEEAKKVDMITCIGKNIESIEGIGYFENMLYLQFQINKIQQIPDLSGLTKLFMINFMENDISVVPDLSHCPELAYVSFDGNNITTFPDISNNLKIVELLFRFNQITSLPDLSSHPLLSYLAVGNNPLQSLPDLSANTNLRLLDIASTNLTTFPDLSQNMDLTDLYFSYTSFSVFPDITHNTKLVTLDCSGNLLSSIPDLSAYTDLAYFSCSDNIILTELPDLSKNLKLKLLACSNNRLTQLPDLSKCTLLEYLDCSRNNLTELPDLRNNTQLTKLSCVGNNLTALPDLSLTRVGKVTGSVLETAENRFTFEDLLPTVGLPDFQKLDYEPQAKISADASQTVIPGKLFTIDLNIDDNVTSNIYTWYRNNVVVATTSSNVFTIDHVYASDAGSYRATVTNPNAPGLVLESGVTTLTVDATFGWISDDNFRACLKASYPWVFNNQDYVILAEAVTITEINCTKKGISDISGVEFFTGTGIIYAGDNQITAVPDLSALTSLYRLYLYANNISALPDLSACTGLQELHMSKNNFSTFPDVTGNAANMLSLDFSYNHLTGIPDLSVYQKLIELNVSFNPITSFPDLSPNRELGALKIQGVGLQTFPDLSALVNLTHLSFGHNPQFSTWPDLSNNPRMVGIECPGNGITFIPSLSAYSELSILLCNDNELAALPDLSGCTELKALVCSGNRLHSIPDLSNTYLGSTTYSTALVMSNNYLTFEDIMPLVKGKTYGWLDYDSQKVETVNQEITKDKNESFVLDINMDDALTNNVYKWYRDGVLVGTTSANTLSFSSVQPEHAGVYTCVITNPDLPDLAITWEKLTLSVNGAVPPWTPVTGGTGNHILIIPDNVITDIYGTSLQAGDHVGIFFKDASNVLQLSGRARWNGTSTAVTVWARSEQGAKNGFDTGEQMMVVIWKASEQKSYTMAATYDAQPPYTDQGNFRVNGFSKILAMSVHPVCHRIDLYTGWNLISTFVKATDLSMAGIFQDAGSTVVVKDASGKILYAPEFGITSGTWDITEGYMVYSSTKQFFEVCGRPISAETPIALAKNSYPAFLPYYGNAEVPVGAALAGLGTNYSYAQTITYAEGTGHPQALNYIPAHVINPPIDQIGNMRPGLAYKILLQNNVPAFTYPANISSTNGRVKDVDALMETTYFKTAQAVSMNNAVLVIPDHIFGGTLVTGDEIGVFSSKGRLIGAMVYQGTSMAITLWEHETSGSGDPVTVRLWRTAEGSEYSLELTYANGAEGKFVPNTLLVANAVEVRHGQEFSDGVKIYPNPAAEDVQVMVQVAREGAVRIALYDMMGRERGELLNRTLPAGVHHETFDLSTFPAGQYIYKVNVNNTVTSNKLVIVK